MNIGQDIGNGSQQQQPGALDSITLGQLKAMVNSVPKPKQSYYDFRYDDEDTVMNEIEEFYSYMEMPQLAENLRAWEGSFIGEWMKSPSSTRRSHVELLLEGLEHRDAEVRFTNARRLFYVLQGTFAETTSPEHQLHWIFENCKVVRSAHGVSTIVEAMKIAGSKIDLISHLSESGSTHINITAAEKADFLEEVTTEIYVYLGMLYHLIEVFKGHDDFADELMSLDPPLPVYLFSLVAGFRDKSVKDYPTKKLLLVLWKTLLACCGGIRELARVKKITRELAGLSPVLEEAMPIKSSPIDIETFRQETSVKYPTFTPPPPTPPVDPASAPLTLALPTARLAQAYSPIPIRHHYHHDDDSLHSGLPHNHVPSYHSQPQFGDGPHRIPQPATPAPSPPPLLRPKKRPYETDQNRPFLFPFSQTGRDAKLVPFAINEADKLYSKHMYISLALLQMWQTREECMTAESGLEHMPGSESVFIPPTSSTANDSDAAEPLPDIALLDAKIAEATTAMKEAENGTEKRKAKERREDLMRLKRVEQIYSAILPMMSAGSSVIMKLLLATISASSGIQPQQSTSSIFPPGVASPQEQSMQSPPTLEEIDVSRHREIISKVVSALLLLLLKWFKVSHVMKFHHLGQHLLESNCLLIIQKMFASQEVCIPVVSKAESPENNFFRYCLSHFAKSPQPTGLEDSMLRPSRQTVIRTNTRPNGQKHEEEVELITEFSWRNFFSNINFAKVMQKLSKNRSHRIWMLVQYKSSLVLKRVLRVSHPMLQLHILKLIKSQVPFCGRKWRQTNMKVITSIYLNCRPDLRDEWLIGTEVDDVTDAQAEEQALRHLVKFYNTKRYGPIAASNQHGQVHRRSGSISHQLEGLHPGPELSGILRPLGTPNTVDADVFPPSRSQAPDPSIFLPYVTEDIAFEEEYEDYLSDLGWSDDQTGDRPLFGGNSAWHRLPAFAAEMTDGISDSESIVSIGEIGDDGRLDPAWDDRDALGENLNNWEHMSPKTMAALPKSPASRRLSSGGGLRPVLEFGLDNGSDAESLEDDIEAPPREGPTVDEVEYAYGV